MTTRRHTAFLAAFAGFALAAPFAMSSHAAVQPQNERQDGPLVAVADELTAQEVIDAYIKAIGGADALEKIEHRTDRGTLEFPQLGLKGDIVIRMSRPDKMVMVISIADFGEQKQGFDGEHGWRLDPIQGAAVLKDAELQAIKQASDLRAPLRYSEYYPEMKYAGVTSYDPDGDGELKPVQAHKLELTDTFGNASTEYFSVQSGLLLGGESTQPSPFGEQKVTTRFEQYRQVGDVKYPTRLVQKLGTQEFTVHIEKTTFDPIDASLFEPPVEIKTLIERQKSEDE